MKYYKGMGISWRELVDLANETQFPVLFSQGECISCSGIIMYPQYKSTENCQYSTINLKTGEITSGGVICSMTCEIDQKCQQLIDWLPKPFKLIHEKRCTPEIRLLHRCICKEK